MGEHLEIPDKLLFRIGEVSSLLGVRPHVLRYWETEFPFVRPEKSRTNQRLYKRADIETLAEVKRLLYDEGYTIAGARKHLGRSGRKSSAKKTAPEKTQQLALQSPEAGSINPVAELGELKKLRQRVRQLEEDLAKEQKKGEAIVAEFRKDLEHERTQTSALKSRLRAGLESIRVLTIQSETSDGA